METKKCIKFPSIEQFRNVISNINKTYNFVGLDEEGKAIYDHTKVKPILSFTSTIKCHGTNSGVSFNSVDGMWVQSRENIIDVNHDNAGFSFFVETNKDIFVSFFNIIKDRSNVDLNDNTITIYGEFAGIGIQKGVGVSLLPKSLFIFGIKITPFPIEGEEVPRKAYWVDHIDLKSPDNKIYNIMDYETQIIEIDFNNPILVQNKIIEMTMAVEKECPVAKAFGFDNTIGEGLVFSHTDENGNRISFKSKGEAHSRSRVKTLKQVDDVKINKIIDIANKVSTSSRLSQMLTESCNLINGDSIDRSKLGGYLRMVVNDVLKEELDIIIEAGLEPKDVNKYISDIARKYFFEQELAQQ